MTILFLLGLSGGVHAQSVSWQPPMDTPLVPQKGIFSVFILRKSIRIELKNDRSQGAY